MAGSHADGTAIPGISDLDIWIDTIEPLSSRQRRELFDVILESCPCSFDIMRRETGIGRKAMKFEMRDLDLGLSQLHSFNLVSRPSLRLVKHTRSPFSDTSTLKLPIQVCVFLHDVGL